MLMQPCPAGMSCSDTFWLSADCWMLRSSGRVAGKFAKFCALTAGQAAAQ